MVVGGAENLLCNVINGIDKYYPHIDQYLFTLDEGDAYLDELECLKGVYNLDLNFKTILAKRKKAKAIFTELGIDVIHTHLYQASLFSRFFKNKNSKLISTVHTGYHDPKSLEYSKKRLVLDKVTYKSEYHTIFISESARDQYFKGFKLSKNYHVVHNFASIEEKYNYQLDASNGLKILSIGTLKAQKNFEFLINVIGKYGDSVKLDIYGDGQLKSKLNSIITSKSFNNIKLMGNHKIKAKLFSNYDAFIMSSHYEGMSIALLEALACGMPLVLSDIPSFKVVANNIAKFFDLENAQSLNEILDNLIAEKSQLIELSESSFNRSADFTLSNHLSKLMSIYQ
jgi:glycosyltransferase involved in cell wall biosynthesis